MAAVTAIFARARRQPVHADNVNADWDEHGLTPPAEAPASPDLATSAAMALSGSSAGVNDPAHFVDTTVGADNHHRKDR